MLRQDIDSIGGHLDGSSRDLPQLHLSVQDLSIAALDGDQESIRALDRRLRAPVKSLLTKKVGARAAVLDELVQQAVSEALLALSSGRYDPNIASFVTFVYAVVHKITLRYRQYLGRIRTKPFSSLSDAAIDDINFDQFDDPEELPPLDQIEAIRDCLKSERQTHSLTPEELFVVMGRANGKTYETLARELGRALDTVFRRGRRGIDKLRSCMAAKGHVDS